MMGMRAAKIDAFPMNKPLIPKELIRLKWILGIIKYPRPPPVKAMPVARAHFSLKKKATQVLAGWKRKENPSPMTNP